MRAAQCDRQFAEDRRPDRVGSTARRLALLAAGVAVVAAGSLLAISPAVAADETPAPAAALDTDGGSAACCQATATCEVPRCGRRPLLLRGGRLCGGTLAGLRQRRLLRRGCSRCCCTCEAAAANPDPYAWKDLFDGKTLDGWKVPEFGGDGEVKVDEGAIVLGMGNMMTGITYTGQPPRENYEL